MSRRLDEAGDALPALVEVAMGTCPPAPAMPFRMESGARFALAVPPPRLNIGSASPAFRSGRTDGASHGGFSSLMCGIAGICLTDPQREVDKGLLAAMTERLAHRGPTDRVSTSALRLAWATAG